MVNDRYVIHESSCPRAHHRLAVLGRFIEAGRNRRQSRPASDTRLGPALPEKAAQSRPGATARTTCRRAAPATALRRASAAATDGLPAQSTEGTSAGHQPASRSANCEQEQARGVVAAPVGGCEKSTDCGVRRATAGKRFTPHVTLHGSSLPRQLHAQAARSWVMLGRLRLDGLLGLQGPKLDWWPASPARHPRPNWL